jgi:hypothetical protein
VSMYWAIVPRDLGVGQHTKRVRKKKASPPYSSHPDFGTLGILKEFLEEFEEAL